MKLFSFSHKYSAIGKRPVRECVNIISSDQLVNEPFKIDNDLMTYATSVE